ncbi:MAG: M48 family metalloprotease [Candidatus Moranbacteria bacterium]|nr:M48 family metalloprotease [Candidatus Moranbacteria bacterium]
MAGNGVVFVRGKVEIEDNTRWYSLVTGSLSIFLIIVGLYWLSTRLPGSIRYVEIIGYAFVALAIIFLGTSVGGNHVKWYRWAATWIQSWAAFIVGLSLMIVFWCFCYWLVARYAGEYTGYFKWGAYIAIGVSALTLIFNEPLVYLCLGAVRVRRREDSPHLWDAVEKVTPWHARPLPRIYVIPTGDFNAISFGWGLPGLSAVGATTGLIDGLEQHELEAVMAHEVGHIINKDILISMVLAMITMCIATTGWLLWRFGPFAGGDSSSSDSEGSSSGIATLIFAVVIGGAMYAFGRILGFIMQAFVSRQREYAADATSARIMGSGGPLKSALVKVVNRAGLGSETAGLAFGFMCTADPESGEMLETHPSLANRLRALDQLES